MKFFSELIETFKECNKVVCQLFTALVLLVTAMSIVEKDPDLIIFGVMFSIVTIVIWYLVVLVFHVIFDIIYLIFDIFERIRDRG